jgi:hypothetical protein
MRNLSSDPIVFQQVADYTILKNIFIDDPKAQ